MNNLNDNTEWSELRTTLRFVEEKICHIMEHGGWMMKKDLEEQVKDLLSDRYVILNKMFRMHITEQEVARFKEVNDRLTALTRQMFASHRALTKTRYVNSLEEKDPSCFVEVESVLDVDEGGEVLEFADDADYGSNFAKIIDAIAWTEDLEIRSCTNHPGETIEPDYLDDGTSWSESSLVIPQFEDIIVCYAIHDLCVHKNYSIPDLLRIPSYTIRQNIDMTRKHSV